MITSPATEPGAEGESNPGIPWGELAGLFIGSRLLIYLVAGLSLQVVEKPAGFLPPRTFADWFLRWDALWYWDVAEHGYHFSTIPDKTNVVFLPLYPWLVRALSLDGSLDIRIVGSLISLGALWLAAVSLWRLVEREWHDRRLATWAVAFLLFGPVSFFFSTLFSEALFLALAIGSIAAARNNRWWWAGALGALAALTRFVGLLLIVPLIWEALTREPEARPGESPPPRAVLAALLPMAGFAAYCGVMAVTVGDPWIYFRAEHLWGRHFTWFWTLFAQPSYLQLSLFYRIWFLGTVIVAMGLIAAGALFRIRRTYLVLALTFSAVYLSAHGVESLPRYFSVVFPLYIVAALLARRFAGIGLPLLASSTGLLALSVVLFVNGYWFT